MRQVHDDNGQEVVLQLPLDGRTLHVKIWRVDVGRVPLILLDTNVFANSPEHRTIA